MLLVNDAAVSVKLSTAGSYSKCKVGEQIKLGHLTFNLCKSDH
jgi:hypothetical protein